MRKKKKKKNFKFEILGRTLTILEDYINCAMSLALEESKSQLVVFVFSPFPITKFVDYRSLVLDLEFM